MRSLNKIPLLNLSFHLALLWCLSQNSPYHLTNVGEHFANYSFDRSAAVAFKI